MTEIEDGLVRRVSARQIARSTPAAWSASQTAVAAPIYPVVGRPYVQFLDLPSLSAEAPQTRFQIAVRQKPWRSQVLFVSPEETGFVQRGMVNKAANVGRLVEPLSPGFPARMNWLHSINVELFDGEAESVSQMHLLNGANAAAIRSTIGIWEVVQFQFAQETEPNIWRLAGLLRGQLGTDDAMAAGAPAGASFVVLDDAVQPAGLLASEIGLPLNWRVGPAGADFSSARFVTSSEIGGVRARLPLSPVHLKAARQGNGDLALSWIRRGRVDADSWEGSEIPLAEETEQYRIEISTPLGSNIRTQTVQQPNWLYTAGAIGADLGGASGEIDVAVSQFSMQAGWGISAKRRFVLA